MSSHRHAAVRNAAVRNATVNAIAGRLSLRPPQTTSLELLHRVTELIDLKRRDGPGESLARLRSEFPMIAEFEREFPSICFALATGVGKTRLMGAFISYLRLAHNVHNFFVLAPNLTIYNKLIADFTPNTPKYVFKGIGEFANDAPLVITGDDYESLAGGLFDLKERVKINIFNISKINSEVRGGKSPRIKRLSEYLGQSYFEYLAGLDDLVLLMDESHRYRASAGVRAINELKPVLGLELTATPFVETSRGPIPFKNVIFDYPLGKAMADGFVKEPAVVTRKNFNPAGMSSDEIELLKLEDGVRLHENVKVELETYARESGNVIVKPFLLVIARDTTHARQLYERIESDAFFKGRYRGRVIQVDSSKSGAEEDEMVEKLLKVERRDEPTEIVIHVNMLKEGWDVTNLYTIVPLRAANARILIEQSIGRGLRLPYGRRTGVAAVDRLNIVAHDKFQEIVEDANRPDSPIRLQTLVLTQDELEHGNQTVVSQPLLNTLLSIGTPAGDSAGAAPDDLAAGGTVGAGSSQAASPGAGHGAAGAVPSGEASVSGPAVIPLFTSPQEWCFAQAAFDAIKSLARDPRQLPGASALKKPEVLAGLVKQVLETAPKQLVIPGTGLKVDIAAVVAKVAEVVIDRTIDIPRIQVIPSGEVRSGFHPFQLDLSAVRYAAPSESLWLNYLRTHETATLDLSSGGVEEPRPENYVVRGLVEFDDIAYDLHSELLYDLAAQVVQHLRGIPLEEAEVHQVLRMREGEIARFVHVQMAAHYWEEATGYEVVVSQGMTPLLECAFTCPVGESPMNFRGAPDNKTNMARYVFGGFSRCLYPLQKFDSDSERRLAVILDRDALKWFKPAKGQFKIFYRDGGDHREYQPDFVAETAIRIFMLECKASNQMDDAVVLAKREAAVRWCQNASGHAKSYGGKQWAYALIPHDVIAENMTLDGLVRERGETMTNLGTSGDI